MDIKCSSIKWALMQTYPVDATVDQFWMAMEIYTKRSHIINRRIIGNEMLGQISIQNDQQLQNIFDIISSCQDSTNIIEQLKKISSDTKVCNKEEYQYVIVKKVLPKRTSLEQSIEVVGNDYANSRVNYWNIGTRNSCTPSFSYAFSYKDGNLELWVEEGVSDSEPSWQWVVTKVVPKLVKWMETVEENNSANIASLRLVGVTEYSVLYNKLKDTYGKQLVQMWPENTDPLKFVYEDIGIATYLLLLWAGKAKQRFVDLGCGNGLLVHILNSEGHLGIGYDLRARKIWSMYPPSTVLEVRTIIPSPETVFPDTDWLIGNHSDELTVWIPVMAARSSYSCNFFLLPCCPYEFDGRKFNRTNTSVSQYSDFLTYVESVCCECGIITEKDKLRIPSTKRICFVGNARTYPESHWKHSLDKLQAFLESKCGKGGQDVWCPQFKPRSEEKVRNCTKIHADICEKIVNIVAEQLLIKRRISDQNWNYGGVVEISALARIIPPDTLKELKKECGGLQTLLKNHHYIFKVQSGHVEFRVPTEKDKSQCNVWKKKQCWFYQNHPNSCPLKEDKCSFIHRI